MAIKLKTSLYFPNFKLSIISNDRGIFDLIVRHFPFSKVASHGKRAGGLTIHGSYYKTKYSLLPRSENDCFHGFTLFHNHFVENRQFHLDVGPRTLRTIVDPKKDTITSFIATPPDIEQDLLFDLIFFQPLKCLLQMHDFYLLHSSFVASKGKGVLFTGKSGSGKSTLALALLRRGFNYLADDEVILCKSRSGVRCSPFSSLPKLKKDSLRFFPEFKDAARGISGKKDKVAIHPGGLLYQELKEAARPYLLIFPRWVKSSRTRIEPLNKAVILKHLLKEEPMYLKTSSQHVSPHRFDVVGRLLAQARVYRLYYRDEDIDKACIMIEDLLRRR